MQNKKSLLLILGVFVCIGIVGTILFVKSPKINSTAPQTYQVTQDGKIVINLTQLNNSGESGTATLEEKGSYVIVTLSVKGGKSGITQPAHIHLGSCPGLGSIKYPLKNVVNGTSVTTLNLSLTQLKQELPLAINVHESSDNIKNYVSCGEISLP